MNAFTAEMAIGTKAEEWRESHYSPINQEPMAREIAEWIDQHCQVAGNVQTVIEYLTRQTLPVEGPMSPLYGNLEGQFWPWNRAGGRFLERGHADAAADIWAACYLAFLSLQARYHFRTHKGMPLCNLGVAFSKANDTDLAVLSWLLGLVEDTLTDWDSVLQTQNFKNLMASKFVSDNLTQFAEEVAIRFVDGGIIPWLPECVVDLAIHPLEDTIKAETMDALAHLSIQLLQCYPNLPEMEKPAEFLKTFWSSVTPTTSEITGVFVK